MVKSTLSFRRVFLGQILCCAVLAGALGCAGTTTGTVTPPVIVSAISVTVSGAAQTRLGLTTQFTATVNNTTNQAVTWQVGGVTGGSASSGTITAAGLYTAPVTLPNPNTVSITAVSQALSTASNSVSEAIWNPLATVTSAVATQLANSQNVLVDVRGTNFISSSQIALGGVPVTTTFVSSTELQATFTPAGGATSVAVAVVNPDPGTNTTVPLTISFTVVKASVAAAARLLDQATFGPTLTDIQHVQSIGLDAYLTEQFATPATLMADISNPPPAVCVNTIKPCVESEWWQNALTGPDQLRQRVALALSEMFVISTNSNNPATVPPYQNMLEQDAFGNFLTVMHDVTLSTGMGNYLNMLNSYKPGNGQIANENYARELMQLFTIGLNLLNPDGTPQLDGSGNMIPTYTQAQVQAFARAYTGWTYANAAGGAPLHYPNYPATYDLPMAALESAHDLTAKTLLNGTVLPAGQSSQQDLTGALANLFAHPNVGPFVCKQLIQHLVASNPTPAYVARISAIFADNGNGVRGDLRAVVRAILLDPEARAGDTNASAEGGHLREPMLYLTDVMRGLGYVNTDATGFYGTLSNYSGPLSQRPYESPSVFNFFPPEYVIPGSSINAPEFGQENTASTILRLTLANQLVYSQISGFKVDLSATSPLGLMAANPGNLVDSLATVFMHGQMPAAMRTAIVNHITTFTDPGERVRVATYLVITSSLYKIEH